VGNEEAAPPKGHDAAIVFAPAGDLVPFALRATRSGGTVVVAGIHLSEIPALDYASTLFGERDLRSVTANTRQDGVEFLRLVRNLGIAPRVTAYPFGEADRALDDLRGGRVSGSVRSSWADGGHRSEAQGRASDGGLRTIFGFFCRSVREEQFAAEPEQDERPDEPAEDHHHE
jgi:hypothetical protein